MNSDGTKGRRGGAGKPWENNRSRPSSRREAGGPAGSGFRRQDTPNAGAGRPRDDDDQGWRPFPPRRQESGFRDRDQRSFEDRRPGGRDRFDRDAAPREDDRSPFRGSENNSLRSRDDDERPRFRDRERPSFNSDWHADRPAFRGGDRDRPAFRGEDGERSSFRGGDNDRPAFRGGNNDRLPFRGDDRGRPPFRGGRSADAPEQPTYRQGRGGYRQYEQRPRDDDRFGGRSRSFEDRSRDGGRPFERPPFGGRSGGRREEGTPFEGTGRPLGTSTRQGRGPVNQFERIQADIYGRWPVLESLRAGNVTRVYLAAGVKDTADHLQEIQTLAAEQHIPVVRVDRFALDNVLGGVNHQGIAAAAKPFTYTDFEDIVAGAGRNARQPLLVLFDNVQDPQNLGSILRTAEAVGADGAVLPKHNQAGITPAVVRASAGAVEHLKVAEVTNLRQSMNRLKETGYWIVGLDMEGGTDYDNFDVDGPIALVIGGEGKGLSRLIGEECDYLVRLPMRGKVGSLNASVAAGIVLYEIGRRRGFAETEPPVSQATVSEISTDVVARAVGAVRVAEEIEPDDTYAEDFVSEEIDEIEALDHVDEAEEEPAEEGDFAILDEDEDEPEGESGDEDQDSAGKDRADEAGDGDQE